MAERKNYLLKTCSPEYQELPEFCGQPLTHVNQRGSFGDTPLHTASVRGLLDEVEALLSAGADLNARGKFENTPLPGNSRNRR